MPDPTKLNVQFNLKVPWLFKEFIAERAMSEKTSQNQLAMAALLEMYGAEFAKYEAEYARKQALVARAMTRDAGATS